MRKDVLILSQLGSHPELLQRVQAEIRKGKGREATRRSSPEDQAYLQTMRKGIHVPEYAGALSQLLQQLPEAAPGGDEGEIQQEEGIKIERGEKYRSVSNQLHDKEL